jgi:N-acetylmuramoyl-L-alanine amidase
LQPEEKPTNGVAGHNANSVHVSYIGGVDAKGKAVDNRTLEQKASMLLILRKLRKNYPEAVICGHRDFPGVKKDCPSFDARMAYKDL